MPEPGFFKISDDVVLNIFSKLDDDPRNWASLACVCTKFSSLIHTICVKQKCSETIPAVSADLLTATSAPPGGWAALLKLTVCCPGLLHAGVLLENSDFGLERELGPEENFHRTVQNPDPKPPPQPCSRNPESDTLALDSSWSLYDDLYFDTVHNASESQDGVSGEIAEKGGKEIEVGIEPPVCKKRKISRSFTSHLASGVWTLSREQGNKLLASRFRGDCLYICSWPGCIHSGEKRNYMLFRGIFKDFKRSRVWRTINDGNRNKIDLNCAFCSCKETWDLHSSFCLRRVFGYHDDGEPVVRAYVCENGHVSGAWTDWPLYT